MKTNDTRIRLRGAGLPGQFGGGVVALVLAFSASAGLSWDKPDPFIANLLALAIAVRATRLGVWVEGEEVQARSWFRNYRFPSPRDVTTQGYDGFIRWGAPGESPYLQVIRVYDAHGKAYGLSFTITTPSGAKRQAEQLRRMLGLTGRKPLGEKGRHSR